MEQVQQPRLKADREYRRFNCFEIRSPLEDMQESNFMYVEGYALMFDQPTVIYEMDGIEYKEVIARNALNNTDMTDVIMNYDHEGKVLARTRNKTLELRVDEKGLFIRANLGGTEEGRELYEEIMGGYVDKMSFAFTAQSSEYDKQTRTRTITGIKKIYDVSAVSIPAYDSTTIQARSFFNLEREKELALDSANRRRKLLLKTFC